MPNTFQLIRKKNNKAITLNRLDAIICRLVGVECLKKHYGGKQYDWFNSIGWYIAMGNSLGSKELELTLYKNDILAIDDWIAKKYGIEVAIKIRNDWKKIYKFLCNNFISVAGYSVK